MIMPPGHCESCRFWGNERAHTLDHPYGTCRRHAAPESSPMVLPYHDPSDPSISGPLVRRAEWRWTAFDDWCGEHAPNGGDVDA